MQHSETVKLFPYLENYCYTYVCIRSAMDPPCVKLKQMA